MVVVEAFAKGHRVRRLLCVFAKVQVVPPSRVLEQMHNTYGIAGFPSVFKIDVRREFVDGILERQLALIRQHENRQGCEGF